MKPAAGQPSETASRLASLFPAVAAGVSPISGDGVTFQPLPEPAPGVEATVLEINDISLFRRGTHWQQQRWQLSPGPYQAKWTRLVLAPGIWLIHESSNRGQRILARAAADFLAASFHRAGSGLMRINGLPLGPQEPMLLGRGAAVDATVSDSLEAWGLYFFPQAWDALWPNEADREGLLSRWLELGATPIKGDPEHVLSLHRLMLELAEVRHWPEAWATMPARYFADLAAEHLGTLLRSAAPRQPEVTVGRPSLRRMAAMEAERYLIAAGDRPVSTLELCRHIGVSERTLQAAMLEQIGMSPMEYMRTIRMNQARRALRDPSPETTVHSVAVRFGFLHHGRFAAQYREQFGESPGQTLRRFQGRRSAEGV